MLFPDSLVAKTKFQISLFQYVVSNLIISMQSKFLSWSRFAVIVILRIADAGVKSKRCSS